MARAGHMTADAESADFLTFTNSALVHASDDRSVTEGLEALRPWPGAWAL
jgi:hypothetical protein